VDDEGREVVLKVVEEVEEEATKDYRKYDDRRLERDVQALFQRISDYAKNTDTRPAAKGIGPKELVTAATAFKDTAPTEMRLLSIKESSTVQERKEYEDYMKGLLGNAERLDDMARAVEDNQMVTAFWLFEVRFEKLTIVFRDGFGISLRQ
jgi:hypothetical protein